MRAYVRTPLTAISVVLRGADTDGLGGRVDARRVVDAHDVTTEVRRRVVVMHAADFIAFIASKHLQCTFTDRLCSLDYV